MFAHVHPAHAAFAIGAPLAAHTQPALRTGLMAPAWRLLHVSRREIPDLTQVATFSGPLSPVFQGVYLCSAQCTSYDEGASWRSGRPVLPIGGLWGPMERTLKLRPHGEPQRQGLFGAAVPYAVKSSQVKNYSQIHRAGRQAGAIKPVRRAGWEWAESLPQQQRAARAGCTCAGASILFVWAKQNYDRY